MGIGLVIDARPSQETHLTSVFRPRDEWRLHGRASYDTHGSSPVTASGTLAPQTLTTWATAIANHESLASNQASTTLDTLSTALDQYFFLPAHGACTVPAQSILAKIQVGTHGGAASIIMTDVTLDLVKIAADGTVTSLGSATDSSGATHSTATYVRGEKTFNITIAADTAIADGEQLAFRVRATFRSSSAGTAVYVCINAEGGSGASPTISATRSSILFDAV